MRTLTFRSTAIVLLFVLSTLTFGQNSGQLTLDKFFLKINSESFSSSTRSNALQILEIGSIEQILTANDFTNISTAFPRIAKIDIDPYGLERVFVIDIEPNSDIISLTQALSTLPEVEYAEPMYIRELYDTQFIPNDPYFNQSWHHPVVDTPEAWDIQTGSDTVVIAIIDTGVDTDHPDLVDNLWINPNEIPDNGIDDDLNGKIDDIYGWDFSSNNNDVNHEWGWHPYDAEDHGSHCAGIAAGVANNSIGITGASHNSKIMACKIFPYTNDAAAANALIYAADNGAHILSNSWGGGGSSATIQSAILYARNVQNCVVLFAAGNDGSSSPHYPGANDGVVCVGATNSYDGRASFSNYGSWVDMCSPGTGIWSCTDPDNPAHNSLYQAWDGTSMATPLAAGVAALIKSQYPGMSAADLETRLIDGDDVGNLQMGLRVNALKALTAFNISHTPQTNISDPNNPINIEADIFAAEGSTFTVTLNYAISGSVFSSVNMVEDLPGTWSAEIPGQDGGSVVEYYIHAIDGDGNEAFHPLSSPAVPHFFLVGSLGFFSTVSFDDAETDQGWSLGVTGDNATAGIWVRENPIGTWEDSDPVQPEDDHTEAGTLCFVTGNADFTGDNSGAGDVDGGYTTLESPVYPIAPGLSPIISYWRWYSNDLGYSPGTDAWQVQIRNLDGAWITLEQTSQANNSWIEKQFLVKNYIENPSFLQLRFIADDSGDGSLVEAAVDDIRIFYAGDAGFMPGDVNLDGMISVQDVVLLVAHILGNSTLEGNAVFAADYNLDATVNIQDVITLVAAILG